MNQKEFINEVGAIASIISQEFFEEIRQAISASEGRVGTHYQISLIAQDFTQDHKHVKEWEEFSESIGCSDWEECISNYTQKRIDKLKKTLSHEKN